MDYNFSVDSNKVNQNAVPGEKTVFKKSTIEVLYCGHSNSDFALSGWSRYFPLPFLKKARIVHNQFSWGKTPDELSKLQET